jgi:hypothetical protein
VQLPQDAAQDLAVIAPWPATAAVGGQQRLYQSECLIGELEHRLLLADDFQERDAIDPHCHRQQSAAAVLVLRSLSAV